MRVVHVEALIALLSLLGDEDLKDLGMTPAQVDALDDVWEHANSAYEDATGEEHALANPSQRDDRTKPEIFVIPPNTLWN